MGLAFCTSLERSLGTFAQTGGKHCAGGMHRVSNVLRRLRGRLSTFPQEPGKFTPQALPRGDAQQAVAQAAPRATGNGHKVRLCRAHVAFLPLLALCDIQCLFLSAFLCVLRSFQGSTMLCFSSTRFAAGCPSASWPRWFLLAFSTFANRFLA
jgi:hypothetical protein